MLIQQVVKYGKIDKPIILCILAGEDITLGLYYYLNKDKAIHYIVKEANAQGISINKLCDGIIDPGNFNKYLNQRTAENMKLEKVLELCQRMHITTSELESNRCRFQGNISEQFRNIIDMCKAGDYEEAEKMIYSLKDDEYYMSSDIVQAVKWIEGIIISDYQKNYTHVAAVLDKALELHFGGFDYQKLDKLKFSDVEWCILDTLFECKQKDGDYMGCMESYSLMLKNPSLKYVENKSIAIRIYRSCIELACYEQQWKVAIDKCEEAISFCVATNEYKELPDVLLLRSKLGQETNCQEDAEEYYNQAYYLASIQKNKECLERIKKYKESLKLHI